MGRAIARALPGDVQNAGLPECRTETDIKKTRAGDFRRYDIRGGIA